MDMLIVQAEERDWGMLPGEHEVLDFRAQTPLGVSGWVRGRSEGMGIVRKSNHK